MARKKTATPLIRAADVEIDKEQAFAHPLNPNSEVRGISLSERAGMQRLGVHLVKVAAGKDAFIYHTHTTEEEFVYILSGRGMAEIEDQEFEVGPGDFLGFAAPSVGHHLRNPFDEDLVYLLGRERKDVEIADFPRIGKRIIRVGGEAHIIDNDQLHSFWRRDEDSE